MQTPRLESDHHKSIYANSKDGELFFCASIPSAETLDSSQPECLDAEHGTDNITLVHLNLQFLVTYVQFFKFQLRHYRITEMVGVKVSTDGVVVPLRVWLTAA